ncbi:MAG TPA: hypothetical protein PLT37_11230 [Kiritimatiellia bacterium]|jgi:hypothetical protein|nr:MAG: hypothetical protein BWX54_01732 [Verrucomicrobia bacterium ADurb.Bin018]HOU57775.1 hypothetical protein [Smithellaceae bacterium]HQF21796.1 hypothetical protein [Kiritimatiellia bacterium]
MTLQQWQSNGWLKAEPTSRAEIANMLAMVDRDLQDAASSISPDWRLGIAYNAALKLCTILLRAKGYRPSHGLQHYRAIMAMPLILGQKKNDDANYLDTCRTKRNTVEYDYVGGASNADADELIAFTAGLKTEVLQWLKDNHPELL